MRVWWVHHIHAISNSNAMPPTNRYKHFLKLRDGSSAQPSRKVKMRGDAILIASSFVFHFVFSSLWPKSYTSGPCLGGDTYIHGIHVFVRYWFYSLSSASCTLWAFANPLWQAGSCKWQGWRCPGPWTHQMSLETWRESSGFQNCLFSKLSWCLESVGISIYSKAFEYSIVCLCSLDQFSPECQLVHFIPLPKFLFTRFLCKKSGSIKLKLIEPPFCACFKVIQCIVHQIQTRWLWDDA